MTAFGYAPSLSGSRTHAMAIERRARAVEAENAALRARLAELQGPPAPGRLCVREIQAAVCAYYRISLLDMLSQRRARAVVRPRQAAMYLCKTLTLRSLPDIGRRFGGRDHTTVLWAVRRVDQLMAADPDFAAEVEALRRQLAPEAAE